jgi:hypothetical protein
VSQRRLLQSEGLKKDSSPETISYSGLTVFVISSLAAAWIAAGSTGLLAHPLRRVLTLVFLGIAILAHRPCPWEKNSSRLIIFITICIAIYMITSPSMVINIMAVSLVLAGYAMITSGQAKKISGILSASVLIFAIYRITYISIPFIWLISDKISYLLGKITGSITNKSLSSGSSFSGIDFIVLMSVFWILCLRATAKPWKTRVLYGFLGILGGQIIYLIILSYTPKLLETIVVPTTQANTVTGEVTWSWASLIHKAIPWNLPILACVIQILIAAAMFRWIQWLDETAQEKPKKTLFFSRNKYIVWITGPILAILLPFILTLYPNQLILHGKKIVFYEKGFLNWLKPEHGQYGRLSSGMYGMLPIFIESMGGSSLISKDLSEEDIRPR